MAAGKVAMEAVAADVMYRATYEVKPADVKKHFETISKTRQLTDSEKNLRSLSFVANELKVDKYLSYHKDPAVLEAQNISDAIVRKIQEHPKWDVNLSSISNLSPYMELLKNTFGAKSYGWAWFSKQRGDKAGAKKILLEVYEDGFQNTMKMKMLHFNGSSPLTELEFVQKALEPMIDANEKLLIDTKMQTMKKHFSNLPNSNILT